MSKRIFALALCFVMLLPCLFSCASNGEEDPGAYITMYLTDEIYDFDPAKAYYNSGTINIVSMMFETLFKLDENGKVVKGLTKSYEIIEDEANDEYAMVITLKETKWSNGQDLTAEDVVFAWRRLLNQDNSYAAASLLFDIKNARAVKEGDEAPDDLGVEALEPTILRITFEGRIDYDQFLLNLTSVATAPLSEGNVAKNADWAKKSSTIVTSGPFKLGRIKYDAIEGAKKVTDDNAEKKDGTIGTASTSPMRISYFYLERNRHYYRDEEKEQKIDKSVTPYRILVDCTMSDEEILQAYKDGKLFYMGDIPLSLRGDDFVKENVTLSDALSTTVCYLNESVEPFNYVEVREALSLAIDRDAIAEKVVYAKAATGLVPPSVFATVAGKKATTFREVAGDLIATTQSLDAAKAKLKQKNITASDYSFSIKVAAYDEVHIAIAEMIAADWEELGFRVTVEQVQAVQNNDWLKTQEETPADVCDDLFVEALERGKYEVLLCDSTAFSADAYSVLSGFAKNFSGMALNSTTYEPTPHRSGYDCTEYNNIIEAIYYLPHFAGLDRETDYNTFGDEFYTKEEFQQVYDAVYAVYQKYGITPTTNSKSWADQRATLLYQAERILMMDMPVIPIVFNQNAVMESGEIKNVDATYYSPYYFQETNLKGYKNYTYTETEKDANGDEISTKVSIFENFPEIAWDKMGQ